MEQHSKRNIEYLLTVTQDGRALVLKRDYDQMFAEGDGYFSKEDLRWIDENVDSITMKSIFIPEGKKKILITSTKGRQLEVSLRDIYQEDFKQVMKMGVGERLRSFKFI